MTQLLAGELTAGERCLAEVITSSATPKPASSGRGRAAHARIDLIWDADLYRNHHETD